MKKVAVGSENPVKIDEKYLNPDGVIQRMPREEYKEFVKTLPDGACLFCDVLDKQIIIHEWEYWVLIQPVSPYFKHHVMLNTKRHISKLSELTNEERGELWEADKTIINACEKAGFPRVRMQLHTRFNDTGHPTREHLHIHYYEFDDGDFEFLVPDDAHTVDMKNLLGKYLN